VLDPRLLEILACPVCKAALDYRETVLVCLQCRRHYPVKDGIPDLIAQEAGFLARVLFVCVENSCRSQMAEGFARKLGGGLIEASSAGSKPSGSIDPMAVQAMREKGIDLSGQSSKGLPESSEAWDCVVSMGCGDQCPQLPAKRRLDWEIPDPKGRPVEEFRGVRDLIEEKVRELLGSLGPSPAA